MPDLDWNICLPMRFGDAGAGALSLSRALPSEPRRLDLEGFVQQRFREMHDAQVHHFMPELFGLSDGAGTLCAVAGIRLAAREQLFLESYLDTPIEQQVHAVAGHAVGRNAIVEVGNLAASTLGSARLSIITVTWLLAMGGLEWVAFTGNTALVNSFNRLGLRPVTLCPADPLRLGDERHTWGSYYQTQPSVHVGDIRSGFSRLSQMGLFERFGLPLSLPSALEERCHVA
ncbi:thermostable hemolysin [Pseudomonas sp. CDFA 602]|uniref:thermostable hemolysin n=1 Tax=Pseudomonas californiensis TaxID=2829823 RepID=UPI001E43683E|nr:thermostable hemolysin [Pseudomonas californiensis]MCD5996677.1 thermostable hemolysin [Pseudomonas californiensis]MCD6002252.1 thermostable hemolysin [Pseudomonas californiensis]